MNKIRLRHSRIIDISDTKPRWNLNQIWNSLWINYVGVIKKGETGHSLQKWGQREVNETHPTLYKNIN